MVEFCLKEQSLTLFSRGSSTEISLISGICIHTSSFIETGFFWETPVLARPVMNQHPCTLAAL